jgi:peptidoglycan/xylan/chitin deacetylase (PgdA/CDA1 family)
VIRHLMLWLTALLFLFWLLWPRAWIPSSWRYDAAGGAAAAAAAARAARIEEPETPGAAVARVNEETAREPERSSDQVAVLLLVPTQDAFPAERTLRAAGVPFMVTRDLTAALAHRIVFVPASDHRMDLKKSDVERLRAFVSAGGTFVLQETALSPWPDLTGVARVAPARSRRRISFRPEADPGFALLDRPEELVIPLASPATETGVWTGALTVRRGLAEVVAIFPDTREAAMTRRTLGSGRVYVVGADLRDLVVRPQAGRSFDAARAPSNVFEPAADVWPLIFRAWYEAYTPGWVRLRSLPADASALLLLSHSIESGVSPLAAGNWAVWESSRGVRATWFVQTNDSDSSQPGPFYDSSLALLLRKIRDLGGELAAHTIVHDVGFENLPHGDGLERRRSYRPEADAGKVWGATQTGEVRVPKEILEKDAPGPLTGFRAPALQFPEALDELLSAAGYAWDSSASAARVLTHFPFLLTRGRGMTSASRVVELPMTFEDETPSKEAATADAVLRVLRQVAANEGVVVWQSRPTLDGLPRLAAVLDGLPAGTRVEPLGQAARWWSARERASFWTEPGDDPKSGTLCLILPPDADAAELSFAVSGTVKSCESLTPGLEIACSGRVIRLVRTGGARNAALAFELE